MVVVRVCFGRFRREIIARLVDTSFIFVVDVAVVVLVVVVGVVSSWILFDAVPSAFEATQA